MKIGLRTVAMFLFFGGLPFRFGFDDHLVRAKFRRLFSSVRSFDLDHQRFFRRHFRLGDGNSFGTIGGGEFFGVFDAFLLFDYFGFGSLAGGLLDQEAARPAFTQLAECGALRRVGDGLGEAHHGTLSIESEANKGCTIRFTIPSQVGT